MTEAKDTDGLTRHLMSAMLTYDADHEIPTSDMIWCVLSVAIAAMRACPNSEYRTTMVVAAVKAMVIHSGVDPAELCDAVSKSILSDMPAAGSA